MPSRRISETAAAGAKRPRRSPRLGSQNPELNKFEQLKKFVHDETGDHKPVTSLADHTIDPLKTEITSARGIKLETETSTENAVSGVIVNLLATEVEVKKEQDGAEAAIKSEPDLPNLPISPSKLTGGELKVEVAPNYFPKVTPDAVESSQPKNWDKIYNAVVFMRGLIVTPVDSMGCERMPDSITPEMLRKNPKLYRFQLLISLMLSSQTKDETNFQAMTTLQGHFLKKGYGGLCLEAILDSSEAEIDECIKKVGFHRRKAVYIKKSCEMLRDNFQGDVPKTIEEIVSLPGVGPKMGHLVLQNGWGVNSGIGVDVHLHRLAVMWGWVPKTDKPEVTRNALQDWLPKKYWADINPLLVGFGQTVCAPKANNCDICTLPGLGLCKGANRKLARAELSEKRIEKLGRSRGDLGGLINHRLALLGPKIEVGVDARQ